MIDKDLFKLLGKNKKYIFIVVGIMLIGLFANLVIYASIAWVFDIAFDSSKGIKDYITPFVVAVVAIIVRFIVTVLTGNLKDLLGRTVKKELREKTYSKIVSLGHKGFKDMGSAGLTQVAMEGIEQLDLYYCDYLPQLFYAMIAPFVLFFITVFLNWRPAVALIALVPLIPMSIIMVSKYAKKVFAKYWGKYTTMGDSFLDATQGLKDLKIFQADKRRHKIMNEEAEEFRKITMKVLVMQLASTTIMDLVAYGGAGLGIALTILSLRYGWYDDKFKSLFIILIAVDFFLPMRRFGSAFHVGMNGASAGRKIINLLNEKNPEFGENQVKDTNIEISHVRFTYDGKIDVLKDINMKFENKGFYAISGLSGSGKSTIVKLLMGDAKASDGSILIGGDSINSLSRVSYYSNLAVVSYDSYIFNESIRDNFKMAKVDATDEEIYQCLKLVNLYDTILSFGGLDYVITEGSNNISGGERQRLSLAINLLANKKIYIFDEATSNIDVVSEEIILNNIHKLAEDRLVIVISHRLKNIVRAKYIYHLSNGVVKEEGTHEQLMENKGLYYDLYNTQKSLEEGYLGGDLNAN